MLNYEDLITIETCVPYLLFAILETLHCYLTYHACRREGSLVTRRMTPLRPRIVLGTKERALLLYICIAHTFLPTEKWREDYSGHT